MRPRWSVSAGLGLAWLSLLVAAGGVSGRPGGGQAEHLAALAAAWPVSSGLLVSEVVTGGVSASDEFVELYNAGALPAELSGLELVYVTASGGTITRKATWTTETPVAPGRRLLLANAAGAYAASADLVYSAGVSGSGGVLVLRPVGGEVIDSLAWGDAANGYVEGLPGTAPAAGSSLERLPGGAAGNATDSNDNRADTHVEPAPVAHGLSDPPVPPPSPGPTPSPQPSATPGTSAQPPSPPPPTPTLPVPTPVATPPPSTPTASIPAATPSPAPSPTDAPSPTASPTASPGVITIAAARAAGPEAEVTVQGVVTAPVGRILDERTFVLQDATGGLPVRWNGEAGSLSIGQIVRVRGHLADPYGNLELRSEGDGPPTVVGSGAAPQPRRVSGGALGESTEGWLVSLRGTVVGVDRSSTGSVAIDVEDASGTARVAVSRFVQLERLPVRSEVITVVGIAGQRATGRDRPDGYRVWPRAAEDLVVEAQETPAPTSPGSSPTPRPSERPTPAPSAPGGTSTPAPTPATMSVAEALRRPGQDVSVSGIVTVGPGLLDADARRIVLQDATAAVLLRLPPGRPARAGQRLAATGEIGTYYGAPQLDASVEAPRDLGLAALPAPLPVTTAPLAASLEWRLVRAAGRIEELHRDGDAWTAELVLGDGGRIPISGAARSGIPAATLVEDRGATITGLVRRAYPTAADQRFSILPRDRSDIVLGSSSGGGDGSPNAGGSGGGNSGAGGSAGGGSAAGDPGALDDWWRPSTPGLTGNSSGGDVTGARQTGAVDIALSELPGHEGRIVRVGGRVVDRHGTAVELDDGTARAEARLPQEAALLGRTLAPGDLLNVTGLVARDGARWAVAARTAADIQRVGDFGRVTARASARASAQSPEAAPVVPLARPVGTEPESQGPASGGAGSPIGPVAAALVLLALVILGGGIGGALWLRRGRPRGTPEALRSLFHRPQGGSGGLSGGPPHARSTLDRA